MMDKSTVNSLKNSTMVRMLLVLAAYTFVIAQLSRRNSVWINLGQSIRIENNNGSKSLSSSNMSPAADSPNATFSIQEMIRIEIGKLMTNMSFTASAAVPAAVPVTSGEVMTTNNNQEASVPPSVPSLTSSSSPTASPTGTPTPSPSSQAKPEPSESGTVVAKEQNTTSSTSAISIFYNIFVPSNNEGGAKRSYDIVQEQLGQFDTSDAAQLSDNNLTVYYNTIGYNQSSDRIQALCTERRNLTCHHMEHFDAGYEEVTLQKLHQYCSLPQHASDTVIYLHNKGSYHSGQDSWRRHGTAAATHGDCVRPPPNNDDNDNKCNFCGIAITYIPSVQQRGNMWTAKCSYIKQLRPPRDFQQIMEIVFTKEYTKMRKQNSALHHDLWGVWGPWGFGRERFSNEHWVGSHPSVVPCDLSPFRYENFWRQNWNDTMPSTMYQFAMLPRRELQDREGVKGDAAPSRFSQLVNDTERRLHDYHLLPGLLFRWIVIYGQVPPSDDSVWSVYSSFPDFEFWKNATLTHGTRVLDVVFNLTTPLSKIDLEKALAEASG